MADVLNFKCPCCGAPISFSTQTGEMTCAYCDSSFSMEQLQAANEAEKEDSTSTDMVWSTSSPSLIADENGKVTGYQCPSCGAEMMADENTAATECPYCGSPAIIPHSFEGMYKPELVVPFAVNKEQAKEKFFEFIKGKKLLPKSFTDRNRIEEINGLYVPFWLYSCHAEGSVSFEGVKKNTWEDANYTYEKKNYYHIKRQGGMDFERIPVDASTQMDDATMDSLEPYDMSKAVAFNPGYFSGYLASRYDVSEKDAQPRANERVLSTFRAKMQSEVRDYSDVRQKSDNISLSKSNVKYAMLPVWMMTTQYDGENYTFGINGQTGQTVGRLPVDKGQYYKFLGIAALICMAFLQAVIFFMTKGGITLKGEIIALVISLIIGLIYASALKSGMNNVSIKHNAANYLDERSVKLGQGIDRFIYTKTEKREKPKRA
ncbi:MAG: hypothetical protein IJ608_01685 [Lachnospiraceae bacterium]|nr:hypothetical protein [Lachnospiraceae bacterium]